MYFVKFLQLIFQGLLLQVLHDGTGVVIDVVAVLAIDVERDVHVDLVVAVVTPAEVRRDVVRQEPLRPEKQVRRVPSWYDERGGRRRVQVEH